MRLLSDKNYNAAIAAAKAQSAEETKGFYTSALEEANVYIDNLSHQMAKALQLAPAVGVSRQQIANAYRDNAVLKGIVDFIGHRVGEVFPYLELTRRSDGSEDQAHWLNGLLARPNDRFFPSIFGEALWTNYALFGDTWTYGTRAVGKDFGRASALYVIPSHKLGAKAGSYEELFEGIELTGTKRSKIAAKDVFEVFDYNLDDTSFFGSSRVVAAALYLSVIDKGMRREDTSLQNGGVANIITPKDTALPALKEDKDNAEQELNANRNVNKTLFMRLPVDVHQMGSKPVDLDILSSHKEAVTTLCFVYGLPVDCYYGQAKYENAREAKRQVYEQIAIPFVNKWAEALLSWLGMSKEYQLTVNTDCIDVLHADPYDVATKMNAAGAFTTNEIREAMGWERRDEKWCDEIRVPLGLTFGNEPVDIDEE